MKKDKNKLNGGKEEVADITIFSCSTRKDVKVEADQRRQIEYEWTKLKEKPTKSFNEYLTMRMKEIEEKEKDFDGFKKIWVYINSDGSVREIKKIDDDKEDIREKKNMDKEHKRDMLIALLHAFYYNGVYHQYKNSDMDFEKTYQRFLDEDVNVKERSTYGEYYVKLIQTNKIKKNKQNKKDKKMTREIIEKNDIQINTYWTGHEEGVQITFNKEYRQMTREDAIKFFEIVIEKLKKQRKNDKQNPPWWQKLTEGE